MKISSKTVTRTFVEVDGHEFELWDFVEILDELGSCDGAFNRLVIYNGLIGQVLEERGVAVKNARGSYGRGKNYDEFYERVTSLVEGKNNASDVSAKRNPTQSLFE